MAELSGWGFLTGSRQQLHEKLHRSSGVTHEKLHRSSGVTHEKLHRSSGVTHEKLHRSSGGYSHEVDPEPCRVEHGKEGPNEPGGLSRGHLRRGAR